MNIIDSTWLMYYLTSNPFFHRLLSTDIIFSLVIVIISFFNRYLLTHLSVNSNFKLNISHAFIKVVHSIGIFYLKENEKLIESSPLLKTSLF